MLVVDVQGVRLPPRALQLPFLKPSKVCPVIASYACVQSVIETIQTLTSSCLNCGSLWPGYGGVCFTCEEIFKKFICQNNPTRVQGLNVQAYFEWVPQESDGLSRHLLYLKKRNQKQAWLNYAQKILNPQITEDFKKDCPIYIVPAPPKIVNKRDHAYNWAEALAKSLGAEVHACLRRVSHSAQEQKAKNIFERSLIQMEVNENYTNWPRLWREPIWIFADDIVTTGSTAAAAYRALGSPAHFYVVALAYRRLSCSEKKNLL